MGFFGKILGSAIGSIAQRYIPIYDKNGVQYDGAHIGNQIGQYLPFAHGGMIKNAGASVFNQPVMMRQSRPKKSYQKTKKSRKKK